MFTQDFTHSDLPFPTEGEGANGSVHKGRGWPAETVLFLFGDFPKDFTRNRVVWEAVGSKLMSTDKLNFGQRSKCHIALHILQVLFISYIYYIYMSVFLHVCIFTVCMFDAYGCQKRVLYPLNLG